MNITAGLKSVHREAILVQAGPHDSPKRAGKLCSSMGLNRSRSALKAHAWAASNPRPHD